jgi:uncharacterized protein (UPF0276 family)
MIGDLIVETDEKDGAQYYGLVCDIVLDSWGHQRHVHIEWSGATPRNYRKEYGYSGVNIHNVRRRYKVIRNGVNLP